MVIVLDGKHRGFAFVTYSSSADAQDAIDNMDLNELRGRVLKVNLARPMKGLAQPDGSRASKTPTQEPALLLTSITVWESEDWLQKYAKPLAQSGGVIADILRLSSIDVIPPAGVQGRAAQQKGPTENPPEDDAMEE